MDNLFSSSYDSFRHETEVHVIEAIKKRRQEETILYQNKSIPIAKLLYQHTCQILSEKSLKVYSTRYFTKKTTLSEEVQILEKMQLLLNHLSKKDLSSSDLFARSLSSTWHAVLSMHVKYHSLRKINPQIYLKLTELSQLIKYYKIEKSEHTLGHYLDTFVGQKWFPFPFIETLKELHTQALTPQTRGALPQMIHLCQESIEALKTLC